MDNAQVSVNFGASFVRKTRAAAAKSRQQAQECVARIIKRAKFFCARKVRVVTVVRRFGTEILRFCSRIRVILHAKF